VPIGRPWILLHAGRIRVGVIGVTTETIPNIVTPRNSRDLEIRPVLATVDSLLPLVQPEADLVVVLSHCGLKADSVLAARIPGIDVIVSAHDHQALPEPRLVRNDRATNGVGGALLVETGDWGRNLGRLDLEVEGGRLTGWRGVLLPVTPRIAPDSAVARIVEDYERKIEPLVSRVIATTPYALTIDSVLVAETAIGNLVTDLMRAEAGTDIAVQNGGGIRSPLNAGAVRVSDLYALIPFENTIVTVRLSGAQVDTLCREMVEKRGTGGFGQVSGLSFDVVNSRPVNIRVNGRPLDGRAFYRAATNNFTASGGDGITVFRKAGAFEDTGVLLRDALQAGLERAKVVTARVEGRIRFR
jgi:5'-nucleotidase/UDP-sugar diphosphatase